MKIKALITLLFILPIGVFSQNSSFITYGIEEGLIQSHVQSLVQDNYGNLWIGTIGGLSKYDGTGFKNFTQKDSLAEDWITVSFKSKNGNIWHGHWGGGVTVYNTEKNLFTDLKVEQYSNYKYITSITEDAFGNIWFGTENAGLFYYSQSSGTAAKLNADLSSNLVYSLLTDNSGKIWAGTSSGINIITPVEQGGGKVSGKITLINGQSFSAKSLLAAFDNEVWAGTENFGIVRVNTNSIANNNAENAEITFITTESGLTSNNIKTLYRDNKNNIWIGTKDKGVIQFIPITTDNKSFARGEINVFSNKFELKYYHANIFLQDREGNIWMGTEIGLSKYRGELFRIYNHNDNLVNNLVWAVIQDKSGDIWMGTSDGITRFSFPVIGTKKQYNNPVAQSFTKANGLPENIIISLYEDASGNIWAGTENFGLFVMSKEGKILKKYDVSSGFPDNKIFTIAGDKNGNTWVGTRAGATVIDNTGNIVKTYTTNDGLGANKVYKIYTDSKGTIWFGVLGGYLTSYDGNRFTQYNDAYGISYKFILSITEDKENNIWLCAYGKGVVKYNPNASEKFTTYSIKEGLSSNSPHFITCDKNNNIWIGVPLGIEKFDTKRNTFSLYGRQQGFSGLETNENAVCYDTDGNIWFGTIRGAVKFNPDKDFKNEIEPVTRITNMQLYMKDISFAENAVFKYDENYLSFNVLGVCLSNPNDVYYQYMLDGLDKDWLPATKERKITYSGLPDGNYTLLVKASNNSGLWNSEPVKYSFSISPPFWKTVWFRAAVIIAIILLVFAYIKFREKKLKERQAYLESEVEKRTQELRKEKEIVEKQNHNITESIGYAKRIQQAILPPRETIKKSLPDSFILYQPKDIVSGDFYWAHEQNNKVLFAAVDCTGHGVPGAFMSLIGHNLLEKVVKEQNILTPSKILDSLSKEVSRTLRQEEQSEVKDGMDIAVCCVDKLSLNVEFAGAYNPLYIVRKGEVIEVKSDKIAIGKSGSKNKSDFTNHSIKLEKGDVLYVFSDGYADQKGGPNNKKFYYPPFRKLLSEIHNMPMDEQRKKLKDAINSWKGDNEQYDDMLVFGVRV